MESVRISRFEKLWNVRVYRPYIDLEKRKELPDLESKEILRLLMKQCYLVPRACVLFFFYHTS